VKLANFISFWLDLAMIVPLVALLVLPIINAMPVSLTMSFGMYIVCQIIRIPSIFKHQLPNITVKTL